MTYRRPGTSVSTAKAGLLSVPSPSIQLDEYTIITPVNMNSRDLTGIFDRALALWNDASLPIDGLDLIELVDGLDLVSPKAWFVYDPIFDSKTTGDTFSSFRSSRSC